MNSPCLPIASLLFLLPLLTSAEPAPLTVLAPTSHQIVQRQMTAGGAGQAAVTLTWTGASAIRLRRRSLAPEGSFTSWVDLNGTASQESPARFSVATTIPTGWWCLELAANGTSVAVNPFGVGEVFLIAGQSYAANCNQERMKVADPQHRVSVLDITTGTWRTADDPQPNASSNGGSIWPVFGDRLAADLKVPVGWANVAVAVTSSQQWQAPSALYQSLTKAGRSLGAIRAVFWQQGESDVMAGTPADTYGQRIQALRTAFAKDTGLEAPWLLAKSTLHPTVYTNRAGEDRIRSAIDHLTRLPGFAAGPDTDRLDGDNREKGGSRHFSAQGQRRAAEAWAEVVRKHLTGK